MSGSRNSRIATAFVPLRSCYPYAHSHDRYVRFRHNPDHCATQQAAMRRALPAAGHMNYQSKKVDPCFKTESKWVSEEVGTVTTSQVYYVLPSSRDCRQPNRPQPISGSRLSIRTNPTLPEGTCPRHLELNTFLGPDALVCVRVLDFLHLGHQISSLD